ncbi:ATP-binding protein [Actinomadura spongiicola]|nr:ATP-binding protein [Actinomadura spongiicola]
MVPAIRAYVRGLLTDSPRVDDAELVVAELAANSLQHTPSGEGGHLSVTVEVGPGRTRIAVSDSGAGDWSRPDATETLGDYGRGLILVDALADKVGHDITATGQTMWAELTWTEA